MGPLLLVNAAIAQLEAGAREEAARSANDALLLLEPEPVTPESAALIRDLGAVLLALGDPRGRALLEDAGTMFEDLGEHEIVREIDEHLRTIASLHRESAGSFQAVPPVSRRGG